VEFRELDSGTEVTVAHDRFLEDHDTSLYRTGWDEGLIKLAAVAERGQIDA
jgi:hypothetical protein